MKPFYNLMRLLSDFIWQSTAVPSECVTFFGFLGWGITEGP